MGSMYYLMRNEGLMFGIITMVSIMSLIYILPLIQALIAYEKTKWLERQFAGSTSSGDAENTIREKLLEASKPGQSFPIYKLFKFYFSSMGIVGIIAGLLIILLPSDLGRDAMDWLLFFPLIIGVGLFVLYNAFFKNQGLWREVASVFLYIGFVSTTLLAFGNFNMFDWLRFDILSFIILGAGLFIIFLTKSTFVSYIYMGLVASFAFSAGEMVGYDWMMFLPHLLWVFGIAILYFWIPRLKAAKDVGPKEIIFGILFMFSILALTMTQTAGLILPSLAIVLPGLYIFSKAYYQKATMIISKPIELAVIFIVVTMAILLSVNIFMTIASDSIYLFKYYSFHKQVVYIILVALIAGIFYIYTNDIGEASEDINPMIVLFPLGAFFVSYIFGEYGGHYIMTLFLLGVGYLYIKKGIDKKDGLRVGLGASIFVYTVVVKIMDIFQDFIDSKFMIGLFVLIFGALFLGIVVYIRNKWTVTGFAIKSNKIELHSEVIDDSSERMR